MKERILSMLLVLAMMAGQMEETNAPLIIDAESTVQEITEAEE